MGPRMHADDSPKSVNAHTLTDVHVITSAGAGGVPGGLGNGRVSSLAP